MTAKLQKIFGNKRSFIIDFFYIKNRRVIGLKGNRSNLKFKIRNSKLFCNFAPQNKHHEYGYIVDTLYQCVSICF